MRGRPLFLLAIALLILLVGAAAAIAHSSMADGSSPVNRGVPRETRTPRPSAVSAGLTNACPPQEPAGKIRVEFTGSTYAVATTRRTGFFRTGQDADILLSGVDFNNTGGPLLFNHPAGIASDGTRLLLADRFNNRVLIWNSLPAENEPPALVLGQPDFTGNNPGTGRDQLNTAGDQPYDFFMPAPIDPHYAWMQGDFTPDGRLLMLGRTLHIWDRFPQSADTPPDLSIRGYAPTDPNQAPDFAIGSPDICTNTLDTHFFISNSVVASNGRSLFVASGFDSKLFVWREIPDESGAYPDIVYRLPKGPSDSALWGDTFAMAGWDTVYIWTHLRLNGELPERVLTGRIGSVELRFLSGVAIDDRYFYLLYYKVQVDPDTHVIHSAVSGDGLNWTKGGLRFQNVDSPCYGWTSVPDAVRLPDGRVRLYFVCDKDRNVVASAISQDGLNFISSSPASGSYCGTASGSPPGQGGCRGLPEPGSCCWRGCRAWWRRRRTSSPSLSTPTCWWTGC